MGNGEVYSGQALYAPPPPSSSSSILGGQQQAGLQMGLEEEMELVWGGAAAAPGHFSLEVYQFWLGWSWLGGWAAGRPGGLGFG